MKWLFLLLISVNIMLFAVQIKGKNSSGGASLFSPAVGAQELLLLSELNKGENERCVVIGAFSDEVALDVVVQFLIERGIEHELVEKNINLAPSYWVYVVDDPVDGLKNSLNKVGVESYLISSGELKGRLSVGLFANIDLARGMVQSLKEANVNADFVEKRKVKKIQWISYRQNEVGDNSRIIEGLKSTQIDLGEIKEIFCKSVASEK